MRALAASFALGVLVAGAALSGPAQANGRFPESQRVLEHPGDPNRLYLTATYGLLVTSDRGKSWYSICEQAFAGDYIEGDPLLEVMPDGGLVSGIYVSLNTSRDCGCAWTPALATAPMDSVTDVALDRNGHLLATVRDLGTGVARVRIHESVDGGRTWTLLTNLPDDINEAYTIDAAPSDANRLYLTAVTNKAQNPAVLLSSSDRGKTWTRTEIPGTSNAIQPFIAAVHPTNPDRLYVRTDDWEGQEFAAQDALLQSTDGGKTWVEVLRKNAKLLGFALSPDGGTVLAGYGDPVQAGGRTANSDDFGIYKASESGADFQPIFRATISCLRWTAQGLYACMVQNHPELPSPGMSLGFAPNADFTVASANPFTSLLDVKKVKGPLACTAAQCGDSWSTPIMGNAPVCQQLGAVCAVDVGANIFSCPAGGAGGGAGAGAGSGGAGGAGRDAGAGATSGSGGGSGCGCAATPGAAAGSTGAPVLAVALVVWFTRRRRDVVPARRERPVRPPGTTHRAGGGLTVVVAAVMAGATGACGSGGAQDPDAAPFDNCEGRGEEFFAGIAKTSPAGITMTIVAAEPSPPANSDMNAWTVTLTDAATGAPVLGANLVVSPYMLDHGHGAPNVIATESTDGDGAYVLSPIYLKMTGLWQVTLKATPAGGSESRVMFPFCIPPR